MNVSRIEGAAAIWNDLKSSRARRATNHRTSPHLESRVAIPEAATRGASMNQSANIEPAMPSEKPPPSHPGKPSGFMAFGDALETLLGSAWSLGSLAVRMDSARAGVEWPPLEARFLQPPEDQDFPDRQPIQNTDVEE